jgi:hypothetical protein
MAAQGRPCRLARQPTEHTVGATVEVGNHFWSGEVFGGALESVEVAGRGRAEPGSRLLLLALRCGGGLRSGVAGQDVFEQFCGCPRVQVVDWITVCGSASPTTET